MHIYILCVFSSDKKLWNIPTDSNAARQQEFYIRVTDYFYRGNPNNIIILLETIPLEAEIKM
jgi:hypothetical protein